jgi:hypothetical protein
MKHKLPLIAGATLAIAVAQAQTPVEGVGVAKVLNSNNIKVTSFDHNWSAGARGDGFAIYDQWGQPVLLWDDGAFVRESATVSWSPDSRRVIILDQQGRAAQFFGAELINGQWQIVQLSADPKEPALARVTKAELGKWVNLNTVEITFRHLIDVPPNPEPKWITYTTTISFAEGTATFASK